MSDANTFERISCAVARTLVDAGTCAIVDIRDEQSFLQAHIPEATLLDNQSIGDFIAASDKNVALLVYCYHGNASQQASQYLAEQGFQRVLSVDGGFEQWRADFPELVIGSS